MDFRVISIGAMSANSLWGERANTRSGHATTTLIIADARRILVDPSLPDAVLGARLHERTGLSPRDITDVFLTSFTPEHARAIGIFDHARWLVHEREREIVGVQLATALKDLVTRSERQGGVSKDESLRAVLERDIALLRRCEPAPESLAQRVAIFPLHGVTPGCCGLLIEHPRCTVLVAGDSVPTQDHAERGLVPHSASDLDAAKASFEEAIEIADLIVPGRDNVFMNPTKRPF